MAIWGAVLPDGNSIYVQTFVTLRDTADDSWTTFSLAIERPVQAHFSTSLGRNRLNLPAVRQSRADLVGGRYVTRCNLEEGCADGVDIRSGPSNDEPVVSHVPVGGAVNIVDMQQQWLRLDGGTPRWINVYHVEMFPETVTFLSRSNVNLRVQPGGDVVASVNLNGRYSVLDAARYGESAEPWYRLNVDGQEGWVASRLVNRRNYTFPGVHLIAGLYRYGRGQYGRAVGEFSAFLDTVPEDDNVTRAAAYKFLAASRAASEESGPAPARSLSDLDQALRFTPFDPDVHTMRSLINAGAGANMTEAVQDLKRALEYDSEHEGALTVLRQMSDAAGDDELQSLAADTIEAETEAEFRNLQQIYLR